MKIRLKFRNKFQTHDVDSPNVKLLELLRTASEVFKVDLPNVQISLNANDFVGLHESDAPLSAFGIVSGDIVYVKSLELLDDIRRSMEHECSASLGDNLSTSSGVIRLPFSFGQEPETRVLFTLYATGNLVCIAVSASELKLARQLILPIRDHLVTGALFQQDSLPTPSMIFKNLQLLSNRCKDELIEPLLIQLCLARGMPERIMLTNLPPEVLMRILYFLPLRALGRLMLCNSVLYERIKHCSPLWRMLLKQLNAKIQPMLEAALTRQLRQQQQLQQQRTQQPCEVVPPQAANQEAAPSVPALTEPLDGEENLSDTEEDAIQSYDHFVARYRSLVSQRKNRGLTAVFI